MSQHVVENVVFSSSYICASTDFICKQLHWLTRNSTVWKFSRQSVELKISQFFSAADFFESFLFWLNTSDFLFQDSPLRSSSSPPNSTGSTADSDGWTPGPTSSCPQRPQKAPQDRSRKRPQPAPSLSNHSKRDVSLNSRHVIQLLCPSAVWTAKYAFSAAHNLHSASRWPQKSWEAEEEEEAKGEGVSLWWGNKGTADPRSRTRVSLPSFIQQPSNQRRAWRWVQHPPPPSMPPQPFTL